MSDFLFRTEDIRPEDIDKYFVETGKDREIIDSLKSSNPVILVGSRGVGKSFLLRVAQKELQDSFEKERIFPVYVSFVRSSLLQTSDPEQFKHWMVAKVCSSIIRSLNRAGLLAASPKSLDIITGGYVVGSPHKTRVEQIAESYEESWKNSNTNVNLTGLPVIEDLKEALEDLTDALGIKRFVLFIDEAAHIFLPIQQRQFFTLYRDLRSYCVTCNAAVYPGVTSFGDSFQPVHDTTLLTINRDILSKDYIENMREIVQKQASSELLIAISKNGQNFAVLAYAASGNPRLLLKTLARAPKVNSTQVNETIRDFYRTEIWTEQSNLSEKYIGHKSLIDWGRDFIESTVLPDIKSKNADYITSEKATSAFFWIHRDSPEAVKVALRVLAYTGIVTEHSTGIKATRSEIGTRYLVNLGCLFSQETSPASSGFEIAKSLTPRRMTEYGLNHPSYDSLMKMNNINFDANMNIELTTQMSKPISVLDITNWLKDRLTELSLLTVRDVLDASEAKLKEANYVGDVRARRMKNAAMAAVEEYLSG